MSNLLFVLHISSTWYLVGLCWLVQCVQYPLMNRVGVDRFADYEQGHVAKIGPVVAPMMLIELGTCMLLVGFGGEAFRLPLFLVSIGLLVAIWLSTFLVQVPLHNALIEGFDAERHASLVRTNWIRTLAWSMRGGIVLFMLLGMLQSESS